MAKNGLVFISSAAKVQNVCYKASKYVQKMLYIKINENTERTIPTISKQIVNLYTNAATQCSNIDIRLLLKYDTTSDFKSTQPIDLILYDIDLQKETSRLKQLVLNKQSSCKEQNIDIPASEDCTNVQPIKTYEYVALGGTFDRLHNGHKILLSEAVLRSTKHVTVGVTDVNMIQSKKLWELIEPVEKRISAVLNFLMDINPDLEYHVVPLHDLYGPTKDDPKFQLIVVSEETIVGAKKINEKRAEGGLAPLDTHVIGLAADSAPQRTKEEEEKLSSSNQRMRLLGTLLRPPKRNPAIPDWPYVIGISGGIASGKSSIADKLRAKGVVVIDCDKVAHEFYRPGLPLNRTVADAFGAHIIDAHGEVDRRALGDIVFRDQAQLQKLNSLVWPDVWAETERRVLASDALVVGVEAAVMLAAGWQLLVHQLWAVIVPPDEAIQRLQNRNNLTEEEARRRVEAQPSNAERVAAAHIVFSPYWSYEYTQSQVDRAWDLLQEHLKTRPDFKKDNN